jgi:hypothetical protein
MIINRSVKFSQKNPSMAKAQALRDGLFLAGQVGFNRIEVNSDFMDMAHEMKSGKNSLGSAVALYEECTLFCRNFSEIVLSHCPMKANMATHVLASPLEGHM